MMTLSIEGIILIGFSAIWFIFGAISANWALRELKENQVMRAEAERDQWRRKVENPHLFVCGHCTCAAENEDLRDKLKKSHRREMWLAEKMPLYYGSKKDALQAAEEATREGK